MEKETNYDKERKASTDFENYVANVFGTQRISSRNKVVSRSPDVEHHELFIRCNRRKEISAYKWYQSAKDESPTNKIPLAVLKAPHKPPLVLVDLNDFVKMYQASDEDLLRENRKLKEKLEETLQEYAHIETVDQRRKRVNTVPYVPFGKHIKES